jgi:hypothetical protein
VCANHTPLALASQPHSKAKRWRPKAHKAAGNNKGKKIKAKSTALRPPLRQRKGHHSHTNKTQTVAALALDKPNQTLTHKVSPSEATAAHAPEVHVCGHNAGNNQTPVTLAKPSAKPTAL